MISRARSRTSDVFLEAKPQDVDAHRQRAYAYLRLKQYDKAIEDLDDILEGQGQATPAALNQRADLHLLRKEYDQAIADYTNAIKAKPDEVSNYRDRALAYEATKKRRRGHRGLGRGHQARAPDNVVAHNRRGFLYASKEDYKPRPSRISTRALEKDAGQ